MTYFQPHPKKRIAVAMSGGVDSSVVACLLAREGHEVVGVTAWTLNGPGKCCNDALVNAGRVCEMLGVEYDTVDLRAEFSHYVMDYYNNSYRAGLTPNPCVECNRYVKWEMLVRYAVAELGADYMATGHYAILRDTSEGIGVFRSVDEHKDQTYMMARVYPADLGKTLFPLGELTKPQVFAMAREWNLPTAYSKESQDICFVLDGQHKYMDRVFGQQKGPIVDIDTGRVLGEHDGYYRFTLGQRKGVGVAAGRPVYVVRIDPYANTVYLGDAHHLEGASFIVRDPNWLVPSLGVPQAFPRQMMAQIRYNSAPTPALVEWLDRADMETDTTSGPISLTGSLTGDPPGGPATGTTLKVTLRQPQSAITPGQIAAFYDMDYRQLYGGGYIERHLIHAQMSEADWAHKRDNLPNLYCETPS